MSCLFYILDLGWILLICLSNTTGVVYYVGDFTIENRQKMGRKIGDLFIS
jgi:hypothetical protein